MANGVGKSSENGGKIQKTCIKNASKLLKFFAKSCKRGKTGDEVGKSSENGKVAQKTRHNCSIFF